MQTTPHDVTDFQTQVIERSHELPVLVDFWASWCGPCRALGPVLERVAAEADGAWALAKLSTEEYPELAERFGVQGIPNVKLFVDGRVVDEFVGALPEREVRRWLERALPSSRSTGAAAALALLEAGDATGAAGALQALLAESPGDARVRVALARARLRMDPAAVEATLDGLPDDFAQSAEALRVLAYALTRSDTLPEGPGRPGYEAAVAAVRAGDWDAALAGAVASLQAQRGWAGGASRELGRAVYLLLGIEHPACAKHYRAFAAAMNV